LLRAAADALAGKDEAEELSRMQLAAVTAAALGNTQTREVLARDHLYWTIAYQDVVDAVGREMDQRERAERAEAERDATVTHNRQLQQQLEHRTLVAGELTQRATRAETALREIARGGLHIDQAMAIADRALVKTG
jgi:hypothetical protein